MFCFCLDSPGIPPSADAHESFQGFSYIAPELINARQSDPTYLNDVDRRLRTIVGLKLTPFKDEYELKDALGRGKTSTCFRCIHRQTRVEYAVKIITDVHINDPSSEIEILLRYNQLSHIVRVSNTKKETESYQFLKYIFDRFRYVMHFTIRQQLTL